MYLASEHQTCGSLAKRKCDNYTTHDRFPLDKRKSEPDHTCHNTELHGIKTAVAAVYITISADLLHIFHSHILPVLAAPRLLYPSEKNVVKAQYERSQFTVFNTVNMTG